MTTVCVYNLILLGPPMNPTGVKFTGLPHTGEGEFLREHFIHLEHHPLTVSIQVPEGTNFYGFAKHAGRAVTLTSR